MTARLLENSLKSNLASQTMPQTLFTWHGGETLMRPISFYKKHWNYNENTGRGRQIDNCIQTNGTLTE